jgi:2-haloalkanoic acid dehalogenase type II
VERRGRGVIARRDVEENVKVKLTDFDVLSFDCYGTLIDWEAGIDTALRPWLSRHGLGLSADEVLEVFAQHEAVQQAETPAMPYPDLLACVHQRLGRHWNIPVTDDEASAFGHSVPDWPAFPDVPQALQYLKTYYQLVILSNVDRSSFAASRRRLQVDFDAIYTAQEIGSYKPDRRNFTYMLEQLAAQQIAPSRLLHTAQSLFHDHVPAAAAGLATCWIDRRHAKDGYGATLPPSSQVRPDFRFETLAALVEAHRHEMQQTRPPLRS